MDAQTRSKKRSKRSKKIDPVIEEKKKIAQELYAGVCYVCRRKYGKGFGFHHKEYFYYDLKSDDFVSTIWYHCYLLEIVLNYPGRFWLLCRKCHFLMFLADLEDARFDRLCEVVRSTETRKHVKKLRN